MSDSITNWANRLSNEDIVLLGNALHEILDGAGAIDEAEFEFRLGVTRERALALLRELTDIRRDFSQ